MMAFEETKVQETVFPSPSSPSKKTQLSASPAQGHSTLLSSSPSSSSAAAYSTSRSPDVFDGGQREAAPRESLVRYQPPVAASAAKTALTASAVSAGKKRSTVMSVGAGSRTGSTASSASAKPLQQLAEVLNAILPPVESADAPTGERTLQFVSTEPSSREQVIALQRALDERLQERQARESGICPVREELYSQCFDELIRQVCISSPERGLLMLRVRDELRMSIASYQSLYAASITFGQRKSLQAEIGRDEHAQRLTQLEAEHRAALRSLAQQRAVHDAVERRIAEQRAAEEKRHAEEKDFLRYQAQHLEQFIKQAQQ